MAEGFLQRIRPMAERAQAIDRRWIFLCIALSVILPMFLPIAIPEKITSQTRAV